MLATTRARSAVAIRALLQIDIARLMRRLAVTRATTPLRSTMWRLILPLLAVFCALGHSAAQCLDWSQTFAPNGPNGSVNASAVFDDGGGPKLYLGGQYSRIDGTAVTNVVRWNGTGYDLVASGLPGLVTCLAVLDIGTGASLYAGGDGSVLRWDGMLWTGLPGITGLVSDLVAFDDGTGVMIYAAIGSFGEGGIVRWNGTGWSQVGPPFVEEVYALGVFDDGTGLGLYAGGLFSPVVGQPVQGLARWTGSIWQAVGNAAPNVVYDLAEWDDGSGRKLYVGGSFSNLGGAAGSNIATWDGQHWSAVGGGTNAGVHVIAPAVVQGSPKLIVGGGFSQAGSVTASSIAIWDGLSWASLGVGLHSGVTPGACSTVSMYDSGLGPEIYAAGNFTSAGDAAAPNLARWDGSAWYGLSAGSGIAGRVQAMRTFDDGTGPALYVGGSLTCAGPLAVGPIARWDGQSWSRVGTHALGAGEVETLAVFDDGGGSQLYAGGTFTEIDGVPAARIARWDGSAWAPLTGGGVSSPSGNASVRASLVFDGGGGARLYLAGTFATAGGVAASNIAQFRGSSWMSLAAGLGGQVNALAAFDDGAGSKLYAGGQFPGRVARWDGTAWQILPQGPAGSGGYVYALCAYDESVAPALFVGGVFTQVGGVSTYNIARWTGSAWTTFGAGATGYLGSSIRAFCVFDEGLGGRPRLFAGGLFSQIGNAVGYSVLGWDGSTWAPAAPGGGVSGAAFAMAALDDGQGSAFYVGGSFSATNLTLASGIARYGRHGLSGCDPVTGEAECLGDGSVTACPCSNSGILGNGCENSSMTGGARIDASGQANLATDTVTLHVSGTTPNASVLFFQGTALQAGGAGVPFGDGLRCVAGQQIRLAIRTASGGIANYGAQVSGDPLVSVSGGLTGPTTRHYQVWYRDAVTFCTTATFNLSNGLRLTWGP